MIKVSRSQINARLAHRPAEYWQELAPALVRETPEAAWFDDTHPAWIAARAKYGRAAPVGLGDAVARVTTALGIPPCSGCKRRQEVLNRLMPDVRHPLGKAPAASPVAPGAIASP